MGSVYFFEIVDSTENQSSSKCARLYPTAEGQSLAIPYGISTRGRVFRQDNTPIHTAKATSSFLVSNGVKLIKWPPQSPNLNPIEHLWDELDRVTGKKMAATSCCLSLDSFYRSLQEAWTSISKNYLVKLLNSMPKRIDSVIKSKCAHTKY